MWVVVEGVMVGERRGEMDGIFISAHVESRCGGFDGACHGDDEVGDGSGVGVHETQAAVGKGDVCDGHGGFRDGG